MCWTNTSIWAAQSIQIRQWSHRQLVQYRLQSISVNYDYIENVKETVLENRCVGIREILTSLMDRFNIFQLMLRFIHNAELEPKVLKLLQKRRWVEVAKKMLDNWAKNPTFIKHIITGDETCGFMDLTTKLFNKKLKIVAGTLGHLSRGLYNISERLIFFFCA